MYHLGDGELLGFIYKGSDHLQPSPLLGGFGWVGLG